MDEIGGKTSPFFGGVFFIDFYTKSRINSLILGVYRSVKKAEKWKVTVPPYTKSEYTGFLYLQDRGKNCRGGSKTGLFIPYGLANRGHNYRLEVNNQLLTTFYTFFIDFLMILLNLHTWGMVGLKINEICSKWQCSTFWNIKTNNICSKWQCSTFWSIITSSFGLINLKN